MLIINDQEIQDILTYDYTEHLVHVQEIYVGDVLIYPIHLSSNINTISFDSPLTSTQTYVFRAIGDWTASINNDHFTLDQTKGRGTSSTNDIVLTITANENRTEQKQNATFTVTVGDKMLAVTVNQVAGEKIYSEWQNYLFNINGSYMSYEIVPASGGTLPMELICRRTYTWNGNSSTQGVEDIKVEPKTIIFSDNVATYKNGEIVVENLGTTFKNTTSIEVTCTTEYDSSPISRTFAQDENYVNKIEQLESNKTITFLTMSMDNASAAGDYVYARWTHATNSQYPNGRKFTWLSGATGNQTEAEKGGKVTGVTTYRWSGAKDTFTSLNTSDGTVTVTTKDTNISNQTESNVITGVNTVTFTNNSGLSISTTENGSGKAIQKENKIIALQPDTCSVSFVPEYVSANGGTSQFTTTWNLNRWTQQLSSGATMNKAQAELKEWGNYVYTDSFKSDNSACMVNNWGQVSWSTNNSTSTRSATISRQIYWTWTPNNNYPGQTLTTDPVTYSAISRQQAGSNRYTCSVTLRINCVCTWPAESVFRIVGIDDYHNEITEPTIVSHNKDDLIGTHTLTLSSEQMIEYVQIDLIKDEGQCTVNNMLVSGDGSVATWHSQGGTVIITSTNKETNVIIDLG